jgi:oligopeptide/dipeptide ABC transporter ATP-binding protein
MNQSAHEQRALLEVENLTTCFDTEDGLVTPVDSVSFSIGLGETLGLVGESGCGKSVTSLSIMRLIPTPPGRIASGRVILDGEDLLKKSVHEMDEIRGCKASMIFQEPMTSLNPVFTVGNQIIETIMRHQKVNKVDARARAVEMLKLVGIPSAESRLDDYPHQLSGGMRQRVMIAMSLSCNPKLLIADEPTTALDVTIQAQILELLESLQEQLGMSVLLITHALGVVAEVADRVAVMYAGQIVEEADTESLFSSPVHPYTLGLLQSIPKLDEERDRLQTIEGVVPNPLKMPAGCRFHPRCAHAQERCKVEAPALRAIADGHNVRCWLANPSPSGGER